MSASPKTGCRKFFANRSKTLYHKAYISHRRYAPARPASIGMHRFVRCEDPTLAGPGRGGARSRRAGTVGPAPTVAVSPAPGYPVLVTLVRRRALPRPPKIPPAAVGNLRGAAPTPQQRRPYRPPPRPNSEALKAVVAVLRGDRSAVRYRPRRPGGHHVASQVRAASDQATLVISYLDAGVNSQRVVAPITLRAASWWRSRPRHPGDCDSPSTASRWWCRPTTDNGAHWKRRTKRRTKTRVVPSCHGRRYNR